ncbi:sugar transporter ERD6-like 5 [Cornus florida]|uniref:sugar transporter ERD6-like 5 n=1 Tax=Cornus florida TaxID=4283 RepID=UPI00289C5904|nr:sugar transporter ERD6-like 5 [Cornus florida]
MEEVLLNRSLTLEENPQLDGIANEASGSSAPTRVVLLSIFVAASGSFAYGCASGFSSPAESGIMTDLGLSTADYSLFGSALTIGGMLGAAVSGKIADLIGRRGAMWFLQIFFITGWLSIIFAKGAWSLDIGRLSLGIGAGMNCYVANVYIAEITPKRIRGGCTVFNQLSICYGISLMFFVGNVVTWRVLAVIGTAPSLVQVIGLFFIPESPRWLAKIGKVKEFEATLQRLRGAKCDISQEAAEIRDYTEALRLLPQSRILDLFHRKYAHALIVGVGLMLLVQLGGNGGIAFYASSIFEAGGSSASVGTTAMAIIQIPCSILGVYLMDKCGRRTLLMVTAAVTCLGAFLAGLAFLLQDFDQPKELSAALILSGILVYAAGFSTGVGGTPFVIMSEIFPINIKGSAGSLANLTNWFGSWVVSYSYNFLFEWSSAGVFFMYTIVSGLIVVFVAILVPETKGRTLEEIQASMIDLFH